jgi:hypothetical protein
MKRTIIISAFLLGAVLSSQASAATDNGQTSGGTTGTPTASQHAKQQASHARKSRATRTSSGVVTYNRDSKDPNIGWHTQGGMRVCTQDCDNPEIPGSGYTCRNVQVFGMAMRECDWSSF